MLVVILDNLEDWKIKRKNPDSFVSCVVSYYTRLHMIRYLPRYCNNIAYIFVSLIRVIFGQLTHEDVQSVLA